MLLKKENLNVERFEGIHYYLDDGGYEPVRGHEDDAGLDLRTPVDIVIPSKSSMLIDLGIHFEIPKGWFGKLESKSGLNVINQVFCAGGVIDSGFTGSVKTRLYNYSNTPYRFKKGNKVVQIVFLPISTPTLFLCKTFAETERGNSEFGSTGK